MAKRKSNAGRKSKMTKDVLVKLEDAFTNSFSDEQSCAYAGISVDVLYRYQKRHEQFRKRKEALKMRPDIKAKQTIVSNLGNSIDAWRWLERRDPEFKPTSKLEHSGSVELNPGPAIEMTPDEKKALEVLRIARRKRIEQQARGNK